MGLALSTPGLVIIGKTAKLLFQSDTGTPSPKSQLPQYRAGCRTSSTSPQSSTVASTLLCMATCTWRSEHLRKLKQKLDALYCQDNRRARAQANTIITLRTFRSRRNTASWGSTCQAQMFKSDYMQWGYMTDTQAQPTIVLDVKYIMLIA